MTPISKSDICKIHPDVSPTTVEALLGQMVKSGSIKKIGDRAKIEYFNACIDRTMCAAIKA